MKINAIIERANDGGYWAYTTEDVLNFGFNGYGDTPQEAMDDLRLSIREIRENECPELPDIEPVFRYDVASFLRTFKSQMTLAGLEAITGVDQRQLQRYLSGGRRPSEKTVKKIENGVHDFANRLLDINFA